MGLLLVALGLGVVVALGRRSSRERILGRLPFGGSSADAPIDAVRARPTAAGDVESEDRAGQWDDDGGLVSGSSTG